MNCWTKTAGAVFLGLSLLVSGCGEQAASKTEAPLVKTIVVGEEDSAAVHTFPGSVHGYFESPLAFQLGGRIMQRYVQSGERVSEGQPLFRIDSKDAEEAVSAAQGSLNAAQAQYNLSKSTLARYEQLYSVRAVSDLTMDQTRNSYDLAGAQLDQAQATLARAENNLGFTLLTADRDGVVGSTLYEVGQVVSAGTPVVSIIDDSRKDVYISLTEKQYSKCSVNMPCTVTFWALPGVEVSGTVREIAASPNTTTGTYDTKMTLIDPPDSVVLGMTAEVKFGNMGTNDKIYVPLTAIAQQKRTPAVWVVKDNKVVLTPVQTGEFGTDSVEITSGIGKGDRVVTAGVQKLTDGEEVRI